MMSGRIAQRGALDHHVPIREGCTYSVHQRTASSRSLRRLARKERLKLVCQSWLLENPCSAGQGCHGRSPARRTRHFSCPGTVGRQQALGAVSCGRRRRPRPRPTVLTSSRCPSRRSGSTHRRPERRARACSGRQGAGLAGGRSRSACSWQLFETRCCPGARRATRRASSHGGTRCRIRRRFGIALRKPRGVVRQNRPHWRRRRSWLPGAVGEFARLRSARSSRLRQISRLNSSFCDVPERCHDLTGAVGTEPSVDCVENFWCSLWHRSNI